MKFGSDIEQFYQLIRQDSQLQEKLSNASNVDEFAEIAANLAVENGYNLNKEQIKSFVVQEQSTDIEISDELLLSVAGGKDVGGQPTGTPDYGTCDVFV